MILELADASQPLNHCFIESLIHCSFRELMQ